MRFPVSFAQQRLWFLDQLDARRTDVQHAVRDVARRPARRGRAAAGDGRHGRAPRRAADEHRRLSTACPSKSSPTPARCRSSASSSRRRWTSGERTRQAESIAADRARQPFDLAAGPLIRATLIGAGPDRHLFVLVMHHSISDGESMKILIDELSAVYRAETTGVPASLPPLWMDYGDYAVWQQRPDARRGARPAAGLLARAAPRRTAGPHAAHRPAQASPPVLAGGVATITVDAATTQRLAAVAHGANATMFMVFLTGFVAVLSRYARQTDIVIGTQVAGRTHTELDPMVGMFTNTRPAANLAGRRSDLRRAARPGQGHHRGRAGAPAAPVREAHRGVRARPHARALAAHPGPVRLRVAHAARAGSSWRHLALPWRCSPGPRNSTSPCTRTPRQAEATTLAMEYSTDLFDPAWADRFLRCMATPARARGGRSRHRRWPTCRCCRLRSATS